MPAASRSLMVLGECTTIASAILAASLGNAAQSTPGMAAMGQAIFAVLAGLVGLVAGILTLPALLGQLSRTDDSWGIRLRSAIVGICLFVAVGGLIAASAA